MAKQYLPSGSTLVTLLNEMPRYDLASAYGDMEVEQSFYKTYHEDSFYMSDGKWLPNWDHVMRVEDVPNARTALEALSKLIKIQGSLRAAFNRAAHGKRDQEKAELPPHLQALNAVVKCYQQKCNTDLSADGGNIYAELTKGSIERLLSFIKEKVGISTDDVWLDGGCGYNFFMAYIAQLTSCKVYGIEYVPNKIFLGMKSAVSAMRHEGLINYNIGYVPSDLFLLESLGPATIAYFFDEAFPRRLIKHICKLIKESTTLRAVLFFKPSKDGKLIDRISEWGDLKFQCTIPNMHKYGSGGGNTCYLFTPTRIRRPLQTTRDLQKDPCNLKTMLTEEAMIRDYLEPVWSANDQTARLRHYKQRAIHAEAKLPNKTRTISALNAT
jgi:hypothetical protein